MKILISFGMLLLLIGSALAQDVSYEDRVVQIQKEQTFSLSVVDARSSIPVEIPQNVVEWYIAVWTSVDANASNPLSLFTQVSRLVDPTGVSAIAIGAITTPSGTNKCDVEITDLANQRKFMKGAGSAYVVYDELSRKNFTHGIIKVSGKYKGNFHILLYNGSFTTSIVVHVEVTAIIREKKVTPPNPELERAHNFWNLGWAAYENGDVDKCIEWSKKALAIDKNLGGVCANIGLCYLIKGDQSTAVDYYMDALAAHRKSPKDAKSHLQTEIKDIDDAIQRYPTMTGYKEVRSLLEKEMKRY